MTPVLLLRYMMLETLVERGKAIAQHPPVFGAEVWTKGMLMTGSSASFGSRVNAQVRTFVEEFLASWIQQNPRQ